MFTSLLHDETFATPLGTPLRAPNPTPLRTLPSAKVNDIIHSIHEPSRPPPRAPAEGPAGLFESSKPPPAVYYKPVAKGTAPHVARAPRNAHPLVVAGEAGAAPPGEWMLPVVMEALERQVNKEAVFQGLWANVVRLIVFHFARLLCESAYKFYRRKSPWSTGTGSWWLLTWHVQWVFVGALLVGVVRLVTPQDQCRDLPLTARQRELIGLRAVDTASLETQQRLYEARTGKSVKAPRYEPLKR